MDVHAGDNDPSSSDAASPSSAAGAAANGNSLKSPGLKDADPRNDLGEHPATADAAERKAASAAAASGGAPEAAPTPAMHAYAAQLQSILAAQAAAEPEDLYSYRPPEAAGGGGADHGEAGIAGTGAPPALPRDFRAELRERAIARAAARAQAAQAVFHHAHDPDAPLLRYSYRQPGSAGSGGGAGEDGGAEGGAEAAAAGGGGGALRSPGSTLRSPLVWGTTAYRDLWARARELGAPLLISLPLEFDLFCMLAGTARAEHVRCWVWSHAREPGA